MAGLRSFVVAPVQFDATIDGTAHLTLEDYVQTRDPFGVGLFHQALREIPSTMVSRLTHQSNYDIAVQAGPVPSGTFVIEPHIIGFEINPYPATMYGGGGMTERATMMVVIRDAHDQVLDEVSFPSSLTNAGIYAAGPNYRAWFQRVAGEAADRLLVYLPTRTFVPLRGR